MIDLPLVWAGLIAFAVFAYVVMDGFDLGIGILFPFLKRPGEKEIAMNSIAPVWDGNETWLVLGGGGLFAVFPLAYAILMPALYAPLIAMLLGLIFRGVAFEFRWRDKAHEKWWDSGFTAGSVVAAFSQGVVLGAFVQGVVVDGRAYGGGWYDWVTPFSFLTGFALVAGYALLGATWLVWKTEGVLQDHIRGLAVPALVAVALAMGAVSLWSPFLDPEIYERWFARGHLLYLWPVPFLSAALFLLLWRSVRGSGELGPFLMALGLFTLSYLGLGVSLFPYAVPREVTIWEAAAPDDSLWFLLAGALVLIPMILAYTAYAYWVFRGKVDSAGGYH